MRPQRGSVIFSVDASLYKGRTSATTPSAIRRSREILSGKECPAYPSGQGEWAHISYLTIDTCQHENYSQSLFRLSSVVCFNRLATTYGRAPASAPQSNVPAYPVIAADNYSAVCGQIGNVIETIGKVVKVHAGKTKYGKPYWFIFFNNGKKVVKLNIWSDTKTSILGGPSQSLVGSWFSITGLVDPVYRSHYGDSVSITPSAKNAMRNISERDAKSRLASKWVAGAISHAGAPTVSAPSSNQDLLKGINLLRKRRSLPQGGDRGRCLLSR